MSACLRSLAALGLMALVGCDPGGSGGPVVAPLDPGTTPVQGQEAGKAAPVKSKVTSREARPDAVRSD